MRDSIREKLNDRKGITTVEWALLLALVAVFAVIMWGPSTTPPEEQETSQTESELPVATITVKETESLLKATPELLEKAGMRQVAVMAPEKGVKGGERPSTIWMDTDENLYLIQFKDGKAADIRGPFVETAPSEVVSEGGGS